MLITVNDKQGHVHACADGSWAVQLAHGRWILLGPEVATAYERATPVDAYAVVPTFVDGPRGPGAGRPVGRDDDATITHAVVAHGKVFVTIKGAHKLVLHGPRYAGEDLPPSPFPAGCVLEHWFKAPKLAQPTLGRDMWVANLRLAAEKARMRLARAEHELDLAREALQGAESRLLAANPSTTSPCASADTHTRNATMCEPGQVS